MPEDTSSTTSESTPNPLAVVEEPPPKSALWIIVLLTALFALGVWDFGTGMEPNGCSMTFMYEFPTYVPVTLPVQVQTKFPNYALYAYGEGQSAEPLAEGKFSGIPVLFVPGNSGSFKQVRSLASVALRMALDEDARTDFHFDYFSVDFQEEFSAIYGGTLQAQSAFVAQSIQHILGLYRGQVHAPSSVVLVGHSIGGLVAQSLFVRPQFDKTTVRAIITLATPQDPVVTMDVYTREFYDEIHNYWNVSRATALRDVVFVSIGGGVRDMQVRSGLTHSKFADVNVATTHSPLVWVSTDHRCIAWCKQLVLALNRALFDGVDPARQQITRDAAKLRDVFQYHLLERSTGKRYQSETERFTPTIQFDTNGFWSDHMKRQFSFEREFVESNTQIVVMTFEDDPRHRFLAVDATGIDYNDWIFGCKDTRVLKNTRVCDVGHNLSKLSQVVPSNGKRKFAQLDMHELKKEFGYTHLVVHIPKGKKNVRVHLDVYNELHRHLEYLTPRWITFFKKYPIVSQTAERAVHYNITLLELDQSWQAYDITVRPLGLCSDQMHFGMMRFVTPWAQDVTQSLIAHNDTAQLTARLQMPKSPALIADNPGNPRLDILLNPNCRYSIEIQSAVHKMWGQIVRFYSPMVLPLMIAVLVVALTFQLKDLEKTGECSFLLSVLTSQVTPMSVVMPGRLLGYLVSTAAVAQFVPLTDFQRLTDQGLDFGVLPIILFFVAIGLVSLVSMAAWACVLALGNVANQAVIKFFGPLSPSEAVTELAVAGLTKVPFILSGILIALASATCGSVALCLGTFIHFVHLFKLYEEYLQARLKRALALTNAQEPSLSPVHFQFTLGLIWAFMSVLNFPALLAWSRNLPLQIQLQPDPSLIPAIALAGAMATTWGENAPRRLQFYQQLSVLVQFLAILLVLFGSVSMYRVNYFVSGVFVALALHQLLAPKKIFADVPEETPEADAITAGLLVEKCASMLEPLVALQSFWINCERGILNSPLKAKRFVLQAIWRQMRLNRDVEIDSSEANGALEQRRRSSLHPVPFSPQIIQVGSSSNWEELSLHREVTSAKAPRQALLSRIRQLCGTVFKSPQTSSSTGEPLHDLPETSHGFQSLMALPKTFPQELFHLLKDAGFFLSYYAQTLLGGFRSQIDLNEVKAAPKKILRDLVKLAVDVPGFFWTTGALLLSPLKELQTVPSKFAHDLITLGTEAGSFLGHFVLLALRVVQKRQTTNARQNLAVHVKDFILYYLRLLKLKWEQDNPQGMAPAWQILKNIGIGTLTFAGFSLQVLFKLLKPGERAPVRPRLPRTTMTSESKPELPPKTSLLKSFQEQTEKHFGKVRLPQDLGKLRVPIQRESLIRSNSAELLLQDDLETEDTLERERTTDPSKGGKNKSVKLMSLTEQESMRKSMEEKIKQAPNDVDPDMVIKLHPILDEQERVQMDTEKYFEHQDYREEDNEGEYPTETEDAMEDQSDEALDTTAIEAAEDFQDSGDEEFEREELQGFKSDSESDESSSEESEEAWNRDLGSDEQYRDQDVEQEKSYHGNQEHWPVEAIHSESSDWNQKNEDHDQMGQYESGNLGPEPNEEEMDSIEGSMENLPQSSSREQAMEHWNKRQPSRLIHEYTDSEDEESEMDSESDSSEEESNILSQSESHWNQMEQHIWNSDMNDWQRAKEVSRNLRDLDWNHAELSRPKSPRLDSDSSDESNESDLASDYIGMKSSPMTDEYEETKDVPFSDIPQEDEDWFQEDKTPQRPKKRPPKAKQEELEQTEQTEQTEMSRIDWGEEISEQELQLFEMLKAERHQFPEDARFISDTSEKAIVPDKIKCDNQGYDPASNPDKDPPKRPKKRLRSEKSGESPIVKVSLDLGDELSLAELKLLKTLESGNESDDVDAHQWTANTPMSQNGSKTPREHIQEDDPSMEPAPLEVPPQRPKKKPASKKTDLVNPPKTEVDFGDMKMSAEDLKILDFSKLTEKKVGKLKLPEGIEDEANIHASSLVPRKVVGQDWELKQMELDVQGEQDALRVSKVKHEDARIIPQSRMASKDTNLKNRPAHEVTSSDELKDSQSWSSSLKKKIDEDQGDYEEELLQDNDLAVRIEAPRSNDSEGYSAVEVEEDHSERPREEPSQRMKERHLDPEIELVDVNMAHTQELVQDEWEIDEDMPTLERIDPISVPVIEHKYLLEVLRSKDFELSDEQFEAIYGDEDPTMDHPPASIEVEDSPEVDYQFEEEESEYESDDILEFENIPEVILEDERDEGGLDECQVPLNRFQIDDLDLMSLKFTPEELQKMLQGPLVDNSKDIGTLDRRALKKFASPVDEFRLNRKFVEKSRQDRDQENVRLEDNQSLEELQPLELMSNPNSGEDLELGQALQSPIEPELIPGEEAPQELSRTRSIPDQNQSDESPRGYEKRWFDGCLDNEKRSMGKETPLPPVEDFTEANYQPTMGPVSYEDPTLGIQGTNNEDSDNDLNFLPISRLSHPSIEHLETEAALEADVEVEAEGRQVRAYEDHAMEIQGTPNEDSENDLNFLPISRPSHPSIEHLETEAALEADVEDEAEDRLVRVNKATKKRSKGKFLPTPGSDDDIERDSKDGKPTKERSPRLRRKRVTPILDLALDPNDSVEPRDSAESHPPSSDAEASKASRLYISHFVPLEQGYVPKKLKDPKPGSSNRNSTISTASEGRLSASYDTDKWDGTQPGDKPQPIGPPTELNLGGPLIELVPRGPPIEAVASVSPIDLEASGPCNDPAPLSSGGASEADDVKWVEVLSDFPTHRRTCVEVPRRLDHVRKGRLSASYDTDKWDGTQPGDKPQPIGPPTELNLGGPLIELVPRGPPIEAVASVSPIDLEASGPCNDPAPLSSGGASEADDVFEDIDDIPSKDRVLVPRDHSWESIGAKPKGASGSIQTSEAEFSDLGEDDEDAMDLRSRLSNYRGPMSSGASSRRASFGTPSNLEDGGHAHPLFGSRPGPIRSQSGTSQEGAYLYGHPDDERSSSQLSIYNTDSTLDISIPLDPETRSLLLAQGVHMGEPMEAFAKKVQEAREQLEKELLGLERATPEPASVQPRQRSVSEQRVRSASSLGFSRKTSEYSSPWSKMAKASPAEDEAEIQSSTGRRSRFDFDPRSYGAYLSRSYSTRRSLRERRRDYSWENPDLSIHLSRSRSTDIVGPSPLIPETKEYRARKDMIKSLDDEIVARRKVTRALKTQALMQSVNSRINATHDPPPPVLKFSYGNRPSRYLDSNPPTSGHFSDNTPGNLRKSYDDLANVTLARYMKDRSYTTRLGRRY
eukprot:maker-scaffold59_size442576-snap-gene-3.32 protein:Tk11682 transcript:maker-scaffold59_size442576-snap-gene-3.32-mRNA-1 annotation:"gpi inositol-deacylase"